jgi:hypothetical protein
MKTQEERDDDRYEAERDDAYEAEDKNAILIALLKRAYERLHFLEEENTALEDEICNAIESK